MYANTVELSIVIPCLNEAKTIGSCIIKSRAFLKEKKIDGEIIVADNGSTDGSKKIALEAGAKIICVTQKGYGSALMGGIAAAKGTYTIMGDGDGSYDFRTLDAFVKKLRDGYDLVMGNRFAGKIERGAMPFIHRYLGNPVLSFIGNLLFRSPAKDFHCGLRGFRTSSIQKLNLHTTGMEFASEMIVKSVLNNLKITEVPIVLYPDGRDRKPHLRTWPDGWRHLRFLLLYNTRWTFIYPGASLLILGLIGLLLLLPNQRYIFDVHTMLYCSSLILVGFNVIIFGILSSVVASNSGIVPENNIAKIFKSQKYLEIGLIIGILLLAIGIGLTLYSLYLWKEQHFGDLNPVHMLRITIPAATSIALGIELFFVSFFLGVINLTTNKAQ